MSSHPVFEFSRAKNVFGGTFSRCRATQPRRPKPRLAADCHDGAKN